MGECRICQERTPALFLFPITTQELIQISNGIMNGLVVLNYQDLHGNDDYLLEFTEWKGYKSLANKLSDYFNPATLMDSGFAEV